MRRFALGLVLVLSACGESSSNDPGFGGVGGTTETGGTGGSAGLEEPRVCTASEDCEFPGEYCSRIGLCEAIVGGECVESSDCEFFNEPPRFEVCEVGKCFPQELIFNRFHFRDISLVRLNPETGDFVAESEPQLFEQTWSFVGRWQFGEETQQQELVVELPDGPRGAPNFWTELEWNARYVSVDDPNLVVECNLTFLPSGEAVGAAQFKRMLFPPLGRPGFEVYCSANNWQAPEHQDEPGLLVRYHISDPEGDWVE